MARDDLTDVGARTYDRIRATAKAAKQDVPFAFQRFALERLMVRLEESRWAGLYALKGGMLMLSLPGTMKRPTEDMDLSSSGEVTLEELKDVLTDICAAAPLQEDGLTFDLDHKATRELRVDSPHPTIRAMIDARLHTRHAPVQVRVMLDVSQGEGIYPELRRARMPQTCKGFEPPEIACYPWQTVVAEKLHAILMHGMSSTRMKDYYDLIAISRHMDMSVDELAEAVVVAFAVSGRPIIVEPPGLSDAFAATREKDWKSFLAKRKLVDAPETMQEAVAAVRAFATPVLEAAAGMAVRHKHGA
jgi:hypothetical protein